MITFVRYPGVEAGIQGPRGERFLDNAQFEGALPEMIEQAVQRCLLNVRQSTLIEGIFHRTLPEYPEEALREALVNAVVHRDYSPFVVGSQVRIEMYDDRLEIQSPGGLFGPVNESNLQQAQSTRNQLLMRLLNEIGLVENRGSGIRAMLAALHEAHLEPPRFQDTRSYFRVIFSNHTLLDPAAVTWLNRFAGLPLNSRQRTALAYLYRHEQMTNGDYCRLNNVDPGLATRELRGLVENGVVAMQGSRRWAYYTLTVTPQTEKQSPDLLWQAYDLNPRQRAALAFLQEHSTITTAQYVALTDVAISEQMARKDLRTLIQLGLIRRIGQARSTQYVLADAG